MFKVIQYDKDLSCTADDAQIKFYMSQMNVKKRQLMITLNNESVNIQPGAMQWYVGDVHQSTGLKRDWWIQSRSSLMPRSLVNL